jgi:hypothetical protein
MIAFDVVSMDDRPRRRLRLTIKRGCQRPDLEHRYAIDLNVLDESLKKVQLLSGMPDLAHFLMKFLYIQDVD